MTTTPIPSLTSQPVVDYVRQHYPDVIGYLKQAISETLEVETDSLDEPHDENADPFGPIAFNVAVGIVLADLALEHASVIQRVYGQDPDFDYGAYFPKELRPTEHRPTERIPLMRAYGQLNYPDA